MKKNLVRVLFFAAFFASSIYSASAFDFSSVCGTGQTLYYNILSDSTVSVVYPNHVGDSYYSGYTKPSGSLQVPASVTRNGSTYAVVSIGDCAFHGCTDLTALTLPTTVLSVGNNACSQCTELRAIDMPSTLASIGDNAFMDCSRLESLSLPTSLTLIGVGTFQGCSSLSSVTIGPAVTTIGNVAFEGCSALTSLTIPDAVAMIGNWAFCNCSGLDSIYIGESVSNIFQNTFAGCSHVRFIHYNARNANCSYYSGGAYHSALPVNGLTQLRIGDNVQSVPQYAFANASLLDSIFIGSEVNFIDSSAFAGSTNLHYLYFNSNNFADEDFPTEALSPFGKLSRLVFGNDVRRVPTAAFAERDSLSSVSFGSALVSIGDSAFYNCGFLQGPIQFPSSLTAIGLSAFLNCVHLSDISMGGALATIGNNAFRGCIRLESITLPDGVISIGDSAFFGCALLGGGLSFPASITDIGSHAFANIATITRIEVRSSTPPTIQASTFASAALTTPIFVPCGAVLNYQTADCWENFTNMFELAPFVVSLQVNDTLMGHADLVQQPTCSNYIASIQAFADSGFHFLRWSDGASSNPRLLTLTSDTVFTALFVPDHSRITVTSNDSAYGTVTGSNIYSYNDTAIITATPNEQYHFQCWSDGDTQNPRAVIVTQDTHFIAIFLSNLSTLTATSSDSSMGMVAGGGVYYYQTLATITAIPLYGYHFVNWNDGAVINPRQVAISQDTMFEATFAPNIYTVSLSSNSDLMGTVVGGGSYAYRTSIMLAASAAEGYHFVQWSDGGTANPRTLMVTGDTVLAAQFAPNSYSLELDANDTSLGQVYGSGIYSYGNDVMITAVPNEGSHFVQWSDGDSTNPRTVHIMGNVTYTAQFAVNVYTIMVSSSNTSMGIVSGGGSYGHNTLVTITAISGSGYHFTQWNDGDSTNPRTFPATQNASYVAQFAVNTYSVSVASNNGALGTVSGAGIYANNTQATISALPNYGYHFVQWNDGNTDNPRTVTVTQDALFVAQFDTSVYTITAIGNDTASGTVSGGGTYNYLTNVILTAIPSAHYHFVQWDDGSTDNPRIIPLVCDSQLVALFQIDSHLVTVNSSNPVMGYTSGICTVAYDSVIYITAIANYGYRFEGWSDGCLQNPRRVVVTSDTLFTAQFTANMYNAVITSNDTLLGVVFGGGTYSYLTALTLTATPLGNSHFVNWSDGNTDNPRTLLLTKDTNLTAQFVTNNCALECLSDNSDMGVVSGSGTYDYMSQVAVLATAYPHYHFVRWNDGVTTNPRLLTLVSDTVLVAYFEPDTQYHIHVTINDTLMGRVSGEGLYYYGDQVQLSAIPAQHHHFAYWSDGNTYNPRVIQVIGDATYEAVFSPDMFDVDVTANNPDMGAVYGGGQYQYAAEAILTAVSFPGYAFRSWNDGNSDNPRTILVTDHVSYQAIFYDMLGINDSVNIDGYTVHVIDNIIKINGLNGREATVYDLYGRRIALFDNRDSDVEVAVPSAGVYIVKVAKGMAVKVVVL